MTRPVHAFARYVTPCGRLPSRVVTTSRPWAVTCKRCRFSAGKKVSGAADGPKTSSHTVQQEREKPARAGHATAPSGDCVHNQAQTRTCSVAIRAPSAASDYLIGYRHDACNECGKGVCTPGARFCLACLCRKLDEAGVRLKISSLESMGEFFGAADGQGAPTVDSAQGVTAQPFAALKLCVQCGKPVEESRRVYALPTCYSCLPPPKPLALLVPVLRPDGLHLRDSRGVCVYESVEAEYIERDLAPRTGPVPAPRMSNQLIRRTAAAFAERFGEVFGPLTLRNGGPSE